MIRPSKNLSIWPIPESVVNGRCLWQTGGKPLSNSLFDSMTDFPSCSMAKNPKIELPLRNDFGILCDPKIVPNTNLDTVCFTLPIFLGFSCDCIFVYTPSTSVFNSSIRGLRTTPIDLFCINSLV